jgi:hypothetical protein
VLTVHWVALAGLHAFAPRQARGDDRPELEEGVLQSLGGGGPLVGVPVAERLQEQNSTECLFQDFVTNCTKKLWLAKLSEQASDW